MIPSLPKPRGLGAAAPAIAAAAIVLLALLLRPALAVLPAIAPPPEAFEAPAPVAETRSGYTLR
jgi:hypothetical protein